MDKFNFFFKIQLSSVCWISAAVALKRIMTASIATAIFSDPAIDDYKFVGPSNTYIILIISRSINRSIVVLNCVDVVVVI